MDAVVDYLEQVDPAAARRARARYACFDHVEADPQQYGFAAAFGMREDCEQQVMRQLAELGMMAARDMAGSGGLVADALEQLHAHLSARLGRPARIVVWAHNSHLGDARHTEMGRGGQINVGQLMRQRCAPGEVFILGQTTCSGSVTAATEWDGPAELKKVVPARRDSVEDMLHRVADRLGQGSFVLPPGKSHSALSSLARPPLERAIGVIYRPDTELVSHYFEADPARQFDAILHVGTTSALRPLEFSVKWQPGEVAETYPSGL